MRDDPDLLPLDAAAAAGVPTTEFSMAVDSGPTIRNQQDVVDQLARVSPSTREPLDYTFNRLRQLATTGQADRRMVTETIKPGKGTRRLFIVDRTEPAAAERITLKRLAPMNGRLVQRPRSYADDRPRQLLRWLSTVVREQLPQAREVQSYFDAETKTIYVSTNTGDENAKLRGVLEETGLRGLMEQRNRATTGGRKARHWRKLKAIVEMPAAAGNPLSKVASGNDQRHVHEITKALQENQFRIPAQTFETKGGTSVELHAERRIKRALEADGRQPIDLDLLAGVRRACGFCAADLGFPDERRRGPFWMTENSRFELGGPRRLADHPFIGRDIRRAVGSHITQTRSNTFTIDVDTDSELSTDERLLTTPSQHLDAGDMDVSGNAHAGPIAAHGLPVPANGWCLLYSVVAGASGGWRPEGPPRQVDADNHRAIVAQLNTALATGNLHAAADPEGPLGRSAAALHRSVVRWVGDIGPQNVPADVVAAFRRSEEQMSSLSDDLRHWSDAQLRARLSGAGVTHVRDASWLQASGMESEPALRLRELYSQSRLRELADDPTQRVPSFASPNDQVESEVGPVWDGRTDPRVPEPSARGIPSQFQYLVGRQINLPLELLDSSGLRAAVMETSVDWPLSDDEYEELIHSLQAWEPGTANWDSAYGEMFPGLVAHALGVQLEIRRPGYVERIGPPTGRTVAVAYNGANHYDAIIDTTTKRFPANPKGL